MNCLAEKFAELVKEKKADGYNPVYFYGSNGKYISALLEEIICCYRKNFPDAKACLISGESFVRELCEIIVNGNEEEFRARTRGNELFILDGIDMIAGRESVMEEFYFLFDYLYEHGCQVVIGASVPPKDIEGMWPRIRTQLEGGMICRVDE